MVKLLLLSCTLIFSFLGTAQNNSEGQAAVKDTYNDSLPLKVAALQTHWELQARTFFMSTINEGALKDDYALASGVGIGVLTKPLFGFQVGISGYFIYNLASSKIYEVDALTNQTNRYELGLFDIDGNANRKDLNRLEELYLKYSFRKSSLMLGKIILNTPFLNPQDGRMRPTVEEGLWFNSKVSNKFGINGGWIWKVSPRSTVNWYTMANSMGVYPMGVTTDGSKADYKSNIAGCSGMALANIHYHPNAKTQINVWNAFLENVMNTALVEINTQQTKTTYSTYEGLQYLHQNAINNGGNAEPSKTYMSKAEQANVISAQIGIKRKKINTSLNYTHITGDGRYMMPREWGREIFYTFLNRERNEGFGNLHAVMVKSTYSTTPKLQTVLAYGYYMLPDVKNYRLNKYGMPSYHQLNISGTYLCSGLFKGLQLRIIAVYKINAGKTYDNLKFIYNKVNMLNFNFVIDYHL